MLMEVLKRKQIKTLYLLCAAPGEQHFSALIAPYRAHKPHPFLCQEDDKLSLAALREDARM